jgi:probable F420-dependent oxidoreductase
VARVSVSFALQAHPGAGDQAGAAWVQLARRAEASGFEALCIGDHPGSTAAPFVVLAAVASVTSTLRLGTAVVNAGRWEPLALASEAVALDVVSNGRAFLGVGAGHTPAEWTTVGRDVPGASERAARLNDVLETARRLLAGNPVTFETDHVRLEQATLHWPQPARPEIPILVGGNGRAVLRAGARHADVVELTGLGRTLPDGQYHVPDWTASSVDARVDLVAQSVPADRPAPRLGALVQHVELTDDRTSAALAYLGRLERIIPVEALPTVEELLGVPYALFGTESEIADQLRAHERRWGFTRYTVRADAFDAVVTLIEHLRRTGSHQPPPA